MRFRHRTHEICVGNLETDLARDTPNSHLLSLSLFLSLSPRSFQLVLKRWHDRGDVRRGDKVLPKPGVSVSQSLTPTNCPTEQTNERKQKEADPEWPYKKSCMGLVSSFLPSTISKVQRTYDSGKRRERRFPSSLQPPSKPFSSTGWFPTLLLSPRTVFCRDRLF